MSTLLFEDRFEVAGVTPEACFVYITDPTKGTEWNSIAHSVTTDDPPGVGRDLAINVGLVGITFPVHSTVTVWEDPGRYQIEGSTPFPSRLEARFAAAAGGGTDVYCALEAEPGKFFPLPKRLLRIALQKQFDGDMKKLRGKLAGLS